MIFKTYQIYISKVFTSTLLKTFIVFLSLAFILNIFEEIALEKKSEKKSFMDVMSNIQQAPEFISENPTVLNSNKKITDDVLAEIFAMIGVDQNFNLDNFVVETTNHEKEMGHMIADGKHRIMVLRAILIDFVNRL